MMESRIWARVARLFHIAADPFFTVKMQVNKLVLTEVTKGVYTESPNSTEAQNAVAMAMAHSNLHGMINNLAHGIIDEIERQKSELGKEVAAE